MTKRFEIDLDGGKKAYLSGDFFILETHKSTVKVQETTKKDFANCDFEDQDQEIIVNRVILPVLCDQSLSEQELSNLL